MFVSSSVLCKKGVLLFIGVLVTMQLMNTIGW